MPANPHQSELSHQPTSGGLIPGRKSWTNADHTYDSMLSPSHLRPLAVPLKDCLTLVGFQVLRLVKVVQSAPEDQLATLGSPEDAHNNISAAAATAKKSSSPSAAILGAGGRSADKPDWVLEELTWQSKVYLVDRRTLSVYSCDSADEWPLLVGRLVNDKVSLQVMVPKKLLRGLLSNCVFECISRFYVELGYATARATLRL